MTAEGKYEKLTQFLHSSGQVRVTLSWNTLNQLLEGLPRSAGDRTFWGNSWQRYSAHGWLTAGYVVEHAVPGQYITFFHDPVRAREPGLGRRVRPLN